MYGEIYPESAWELARLGKITSSEVYKLFTEPRSNADKAAGKLSTTAESYLLEKVGELLVGSTRQLQTFATDWGNQYEAEAIERLRSDYPDLEHYGNANRVFFPYTDFSGGSPDALLTPTLVGEIKCPENKINHVQNLLLNNEDDLFEAHPDYWYQLQMNMVCVARFYGISILDMKGLFVSYQPNFLNEKHQMKTIHVSPSLKFSTNLQTVIQRGENFMRGIIKTIGS